MRWQFWYTWIIVGLTVYAHDGRIFDTMVGIPINWLLMYLPAWAVVAIVRRIRRKPVISPAPAEPPSI